MDSIIRLEISALSSLLTIFEKLGAKNEVVRATVKRRYKVSTGFFSHLQALNGNQPLEMLCKFTFEI